MATWNAWADEDPYCWVVICKNHRFHRQQNLYSGHKIPLGETDAFAPPPAIDFSFSVRCDECGEEHSYEADELMRFQMNCGPFQPHPLFA